MTRSSSAPPSTWAVALTAAVALAATLQAAGRPLGGIAGVAVGAVPAYIAGMSALKLGLAGGRYFVAAIVLAAALVLLALV